MSTLALFLGLYELLLSGGPAWCCPGTMESPPSSSAAGTAQGTLIAHRLAHGLSVVTTALSLAQMASCPLFRAISGD